MFGAKHSKTNWLQKTIEYQTHDWVQNIQIEMRKYKVVSCFEIYNQAKLVLAVFTPSLSTLNHIKQALCT